MRFQEMYLPDGDLHTEGAGRMRRFRWSNNGEYFDLLKDKLPEFEVIKLFSCTTQPSMKFILLLNVKMLA